MIKTLFASTSLSLAFLLIPLGAFSPLTGAAGVSAAHAEFGISLGLGAGDDDEGPTIGFGIGAGDDEDDGDGDDEEDD